jgi:hypothetical protein
LPALSAALATNAGENAISATADAGALAPSYGMLVSAVGVARDVREACGMREVRYENRLSGTVGYDAFHYVVAIYDATGRARAFGVGTISL